MLPPESNARHELLPHAIWAVAALVAALLSSHYLPALWTDAPTRLGTVGFFVGLLGLIIAIIEVRRAKTAASRAEHSAREALAFTSSLAASGDLSEGRTLIRSCLRSIEEGTQIPLDNISRILVVHKIASAKTAAFTKEQELHRGMLRSYQFVHGGRSAKQTGVHSGNPKVLEALYFLDEEIGVAEHDLTTNWKKK